MLFGVLRRRRVRVKNGSRGQLVAVVDHRVVDRRQAPSDDDPAAPLENLQAGDRQLEQRLSVVVCSSGTKKPVREMPVDTRLRHHIRYQNVRISRQQRFEFRDAKQLAGRGQQEDRMRLVADGPALMFLDYALRHVRSPQAYTMKSLPP